MPLKPYLGACIPGIPPARTGKLYMKEVDFYFQAHYKKVYERLPLLTQEEVLRAKFPFHALLFRDLLANGYFPVVQELNAIVQLEQQQQSGRNLLNEDKKLILVSNALKECEDFKNMGKKYIGTDRRKTLAEKLIMEFSDIWLAIQFLNSCLDACTIHDSDPTYNRIEAEARCILACVAQGHPAYFDNATDVILDNLIRSRELSKEHNVWQFKHNVITFKIAHPATLHGLRKSFDVIEASGMPLYIFATILLHEVFFNISDRYAKSEKDYNAAKQWAEKALNLAKEVHHAIVLNTAILRYGRLLLHHEDTAQALPYFQELEDHSILQANTLTQAIAINNIGLCFDRQRETLLALEQYYKQLEISKAVDLTETAGGALKDIGKILLDEGQLWEAEECYQKSRSYFSKSENSDVENIHTDVTWAWEGIAAGHNIWTRFAGLCRSEDPESFGRVVQWKIKRQPLPLVKRPDYSPDLIDDFYNPENYNQFTNTDLRRARVKFQGADSKSKTSTSNKRKVKEMLQEVESYEFISDQSADNFLDYRAHSMQRFWSWARSLSEALSKRSDSTLQDMSMKEMLHSGVSRANFGEKGIAPDVQFFNYDYD